MPSISLSSVRLFPFATLHSATLPHLFQGLGTWLTTYIYMSAWAFTGQRNAKRIRENYLRAVLRQDTAYFDTSGGAGEVATRIQSDTRNYILIPDIPTVLSSSPPLLSQIFFNSAHPKKSLVRTQHPLLSLPLYFFSPSPHSRFDLYLFLCHWLCS